jgi:hypothetical protein
MVSPLVCRQTGCGAFEWDGGHAFNDARLAGAVTWRNGNHLNAGDEGPQSGFWGWDTNRLFAGRSGLLPWRV